jgi:tetratricopeptide (TPR) repeat protein
MKPRWRQLPLFLIVAGALLLRVIYLIEIRKSPFFLTPFGDGEYFDSWAMSIASGNIIGMEVFFKAPLYAYVLAFFYWLSGHHLLIPRLLNVFFDAASVFLLYAIAKKLWNRTVGLIAAAMFACGGTFIYFSGEIVGASLAVMLGLAVVNLLLYEGKKLSRWLYTGMVLSLLILVRPNALLLVPAAILFIALAKYAVKTRVLRIVLLLVGVLLPIGVCGVRNYAVGKDFVLINYSGGVNFYIGNNGKSDGVSAVLPGYGNDWDEYGVAEQEAGRALKPSEVSRYWMLQGVRFMAQHPFPATLLMIKKCYLLFNGKEISNNQNIYRFAGNTHLLKWLLFLAGTKLVYIAFPSSLLIALGIVGILLSLLRERRKYLLLYLFLMLFGFSVVLFFISARYRMPFMAFLVPFAAFSLFSLWDSLGKKRGAGLWISLFLPLVVLCNIDPYGISMKNEALECYNLGNAYLRKGELERARAYYEKAIAENPYFPRVHLNLGTLHFKERRYGDSEEAYVTEIEVNPMDGRAHHNLSLLYGQEGRLQDALLFARKAVSISPRLAEAQRNLGRLYLKSEQFDSAAIHLERAYALRMRDAKTLSMLGLAHLRIANPDRSIQYYLEALKLEKEDPFLEYNCGVAYIGKGNFEEAEHHLLQAIHLKHDFAEAHFNLGMVYHQLHDAERARLHFAEALRIQPGLQEAQKMIEKMR